MAGTSEGKQRALVRADLLIKPGHVESTTFQMEFLPSGLLCLGRVDRIHSYSFEAELPHARRYPPPRPRRVAAGRRVAVPGRPNLRERLTGGGGVREPGKSL